MGAEPAPPGIDPVVNGGTLNGSRAGVQPLSPDWLPHWTQSIRFRLSLAFAATVFGVGSILIGGMYAWQVHELDKPIEVEWVRGQVLSSQGMRGAQLADAESLAAEVQNRTKLDAVDDLRRASLAGLGVLAIVAFVSGYVMAGLALRPINRMARVAREISGTSLSRRIALTGPDDELKQLSDTFDAMLDRLQAAFEDQRRFIQDTSHELRNPLASARTNLELVLSDPHATADQLRAAAGVAHRSTERMAHLVDDLLNQARTTVPEVQIGRVDLHGVALEAAADFQAAARKRGLELVVAPPPVPQERMTVKGDRDALFRAASNLISNAVRLAPSNSTITVSVREDEGRTVLQVADQGPGLSPADQAKVFQRFWRGDNAGAGTGLGLSIVRQIAERHNGRAVVDSELGRGSTFSLVLPTCTSARVAPVEPTRS